MGNRPTLTLNGFSGLATMFNDELKPKAQKNSMAVNDMSSRYSSELFQRGPRQGEKAEYLGERLKVIGYVGDCPVYE